MSARGQKGHYEVKKLFQVQLSLDKLSEFEMHESPFGQKFHENVQISRAYSYDPASQL